MMMMMTIRESSRITGNFSELRTVATEQTQSPGAT
jgi:hypothetical protein